MIKALPQNVRKLNPAVYKVKKSHGQISFIPKIQEKSLNAVNHIYKG